MTMEYKPWTYEKAAWAIEAEAECAREGHRAIVDGRCVRCREYGPEPETTALYAEMPMVETVGCPLYTVDQGCPLHGEFCAEAS